MLSINSLTRSFGRAALATAFIAGLGLTGGSVKPTLAAEISSTKTLHKTVKMEGLDIFYREAGPKDAPTLLLLHGFPASSQMFRNLIPALADKYHVVAPDYSGFGNSSMPTVDEFDYIFDNLAHVVDEFTQKFGLKHNSHYVMDYGAPVGFRLATAHPELISPDTWTTDQYFQDRAGNKAIQLKLFFDYGSNPALYPAWQDYSRSYQPPTLVVWGKNDAIFPTDGAHPYKRDLKKVDFHLLDTGHFALEEDGDEIARLIRKFLKDNIT